MTTRYGPLSYRLRCALCRKPLERPDLDRSTFNSNLSHSSRLGMQGWLAGVRWWRWQGNNVKDKGRPCQWRGVGIETKEERVADFAANYVSGNHHDVPLRLTHSRFSLPVLNTYPVHGTHHMPHEAPMSAAKRPAASQ